jgi:LysM repeat protein
MSFLGRLSLVFLAAISLGIVCGCSPSDQSQADEEKEPHFVLGNNRFNTMDFPGAIEAFEQSLEVNPRSAQAHYRLAQLFDTKEPDPAAAIYHYQEYLRLDPNAENPDIIRQRINTCKQQLAADVLPLPSAPATMKQIEDLTEKNRQLQQQVDDLTDKLKQWNTYYNSQVAAKTAAAQAPAPVPTAYAPAGSPQPDDMTAQPANPNPPPAGSGSKPQPPKARTHIVASGETMAAIARKYGVNLSALEEANPGVSPKHLRVGQTLNLPPS